MKFSRRSIADRRTVAENFSRTCTISREIRPNCQFPCSAASSLDANVSRYPCSGQMLPLRRLPPLPLPRGPAPRRLLSAAASAAAASPLPWPGLQAWRRAPPSDLRTWGPNGPCASDVDEPEAGAGAGSTLAEMGALVLSTADPLAKARLTHTAFSRWAAWRLPVGQATAPDHPARPDKPHVVNPPVLPLHLLPSPDARPSSSLETFRRAGGGG